MCEADWQVIVEITGIIVNALLAIWIVRALQSRLNNERVIKDHFINEVKDLRNDFKNFLSAIYAGKKTHGHVIPSLTLIGIKSSQLMRLLSKHFNLNESFLNSVNWELNKIVTDDPNFIACRDESLRIIFTEQTLQQLMKFQRDYNSIFNDIIVELNLNNFSKS